jgi:hypothetical protein
MSRPDVQGPLGSAEGTSDPAWSPRPACKLRCRRVHAPIDRRASLHMQRTLSHAGAIELDTKTLYWVSRYCPVGSVLYTHPFLSRSRPEAQSGSSSWTEASRRLPVRQRGRERPGPGPLSLSRPPLIPAQGQRKSSVSLSCPPLPHARRAASTCPLFGPGSRDVLVLFWTVPFGADRGDGGEAPGPRAAPSPSSASSLEDLVITRYMGDTLAGTALIRGGADPRPPPTASWVSRRGPPAATAWPLSLAPSPSSGRRT